MQKGAEYCIGSPAFKNPSSLSRKKITSSMDALVSSSGASSGASSTSRWNPTKEQISVLEGLYQQGLRTPSAEQIQQITSRLKVYGYIEGKNVFYWFQNHKARQRQKQKHESVVYLSRYLRNTAPVVPSFANVGCNPYCVPPPSLTFYPQLPKILLPGNVKRRSREVRTTVAGDYSFKPTNPASDRMDVDNDNAGGHETLELFPLRPTGILEDKVVNSLSSPSSEANELGSEKGSAIEGWMCL